MSEWLDLMLAEVSRKKAEEKAALEEAARRAGTKPDDDSDKQ
jgi:hypothetical protein